MTKKHFITIAAVLANAPTGTLGSENTRDYIGRQLALIFLEANPRFDADRFLAAADITLRSFPVNVNPTPAEQRDVCDRLLKRGPYAKGGAVMAQHYSDPSRESDPHALPDIEVFELTAEEVVVLDEELMYEALKRFKLANFNSRDRDKAIAWAIEESGCKGGWYWHACFPGCLPDSEPMGPFETYAEALADAQANHE